MTDTTAPPRIRRAIEDSFPIVEINRLAVPERNAFKPIYQMHKWFARRASCVFRAILLGCLKPLPVDENGKPTKTGAQVIMEEFYKDHTNDPDSNGKVILDPFMGGGTTVVEALRLGCKVIGIDLNPVAWFIVKTEVEAVDLEALQQAFDRLAERIVPWSGKPLRETLLSLYKTECPCCGAGREDADIIYTFWVKSAICTACGKQVPLFKDYIITQRSPSIRYYRDAACPKCRKTFDWEIEAAALVAEPSLQINSSTYSAGAGRSTTRWAYSSAKTVSCPWCLEEVTARPSKSKPERKKVPLTVLLCPHCESVWQWRGDVPETVACPVCKKGYNPLSGNVPSKGAFLCSCGHTDDVIRSIRRLPHAELLPMHPYAIQGYCARCGGDGEDEENDGEPGADLFGERSSVYKSNTKVDHPCRLTKSRGKFFKRVTSPDVRRIADATELWERERARLPYPKQAIPDGQETHRLLEHHYLYWHQMFHPRQLLSLATLLNHIAEVAVDEKGRDLLLSAFSMTLDANNLFTRNRTSRNTPGGTAPGGIFSRHDFQPKATLVEQSPWGAPVSGTNTFIRRMAMLSEGVDYARSPFDGEEHRDSKNGRDPLTGLPDIRSVSSNPLPDDLPALDFMITDPPYASNVNYSELADFFYVWLRLVLAHKWPHFSPEICPKTEEIVINVTRDQDAEHFTQGLYGVFNSARLKIKTDGLLVFTFHHREGDAWESLLKALCDAGYVIEAVFPVQGEAENAMPIMGGSNITYDLIHVCRVRSSGISIETRSWAGVRQEIRRRAREELAEIERGRYGADPLSFEDVKLILIGKCLELYSRHYGSVIDHEGKNVPLHDAWKQIRDIADQITERERPLPSELEEIDPESRVYLRALCAIKEVKSDDVHKATRGIMEPSDLIEAGLMTKMRAGRGRSYEVKQPKDRLVSLMEKFQDGPSIPQVNLFGEIERPKEKRGTLFIDRVHLLLGLADAGENLLPWLERFRGETPQIRAALEYIESRNKSLAPACRKVLNLLEVGPLFKR